MWLPADWINQHYPIFCRWLRVRRAPPYKDFARELAHLMRRERKDPRPSGERRRKGEGTPQGSGPSTYTAYFIGARTVADGELSAPERGVRKPATVPRRG